MLSLEEGLSELEGKANAIIERIFDQRSIGGLSEEDRIKLAGIISSRSSAACARTSVAR